MDKTDFAGIEVSKEELLVALRRDDQTLPLQSFPNTAQGHRVVACYLAPTKTRKLLQNFRAPIVFHKDAPPGGPPK